MINGGKETNNCFYNLLVDIAKDIRMQREMIFLSKKNGSATRNEGEGCQNMNMYMEASSIRREYS